METYIPSNVAVQRQEYLRLGLTDSVLLELTVSSAFLLTTDLGLYLAAANAKLPVENYNHIKERYL